MDRRSFLKSLLGAATTTYFLPPIGGWASDVISNPQYRTGKTYVDEACEYDKTIITVVDACSLSRSYNRVCEPITSARLREVMNKVLRAHNRGIWNI